MKIVFRVVSVCGIIVMLGAILKELRQTNRLLNQVLTETRILADEATAQTDMMSSEDE